MALANTAPDRQRTAQLIVRVDVLEPGDGVVRACDLIGRGDSRSAAGRARRKALEDLRESLASISVLEGFSGE